MEDPQTKALHPEYQNRESGWSWFKKSNPPHQLHWLGCDQRIRRGTADQREFAGLARTQHRSTTHTHNGEDPNTFLDTLRPNRGNNKTGWENPKYDELLSLANRTIDRDKRYEILNEAEKLLIDEMPIIPIYTYVRQYQLSSDVKGWYPNFQDIHHPKYIYLERD